MCSNRINLGGTSPALKLFYANVHSSSKRMHSILASNKWDVIFITESPWYQIGSNHKASSLPGFAIMGTTANSAYQLFTAGKDPNKCCYVSAYIHTRIMKSTMVTHCLDIVNNPCIMALEIAGVIYSVVYNKPAFNNRVLTELYSLTFLENTPRTILGDFNIHCPTWDSGVTENSGVSNVFNEWCTNNDLTILNDPNEPTWVVQRLQQFHSSVINLFLISENFPENSVQDWKVNYIESTGADHYPITWNSNSDLGLSPESRDLPYCHKFPPFT
jgi:hypothetical protein